MHRPGAARDRGFTSKKAVNLPRSHFFIPFKISMAFDDIQKPAVIQGVNKVQNAFAATKQINHETIQASPEFAVLPH